MRQAARRMGLLVLTAVQCGSLQPAPARGQTAPPATAGEKGLHLILPRLDGFSPESVTLLAAEAPEQPTNTAIDTLAERRNTAARLKSGLATIGGLEPAELASAVALVDRYGQGATLSEGELQNLEFIRKLVDGSIDLKMYRAGVAKGPPMATPAQLGMAPAKKSIWTNKWFLGGVAVAAVGIGVALSGGDSGGDGGTPVALPAPPPPPPAP